MIRKTTNNKRKHKDSDLSKADVEDQEDNKENENSEINIENKPNKSDDNIEHQQDLNSSTTPTKNEPKLAPDLVNTDFLLPFKYGWTRALVYRSGSNRTKADVYYYNSVGTTFRSFRELSHHFKYGLLTSENFTYLRRPILENGSDEYETVRESGQKNTDKNMSLKKKKAVKNSNPSIQTPSDSVLVTSNNEFESGTNLICSKRCRNQRGIAPSLICVQCNNAYHPSCAIIQPTLINPKFVCLNCESMTTNNADSTVFNSDLESLHINEEKEFVPTSLENACQSVEILGNQKFVIVPRIMLPRMSFLSSPDDLVQVNLGRILPDNTEQISLELFRKTDTVEIDFENLDKE